MSTDTHSPDSLPDDEIARRRSGLILGLGSYVIWGGMPIVFALAAPATPLEILAHRIVWSMALCLVFLALARGFHRLRAVLRSIRTTGILALASIAVAVNWFVFVFGVGSGHVIEVSLGYYINPLISVLMGVLFLGERLRPLQWTAMGVGVISVLVISFGYGQVPWLGLAVAFSFGFYGLIKKQVGPRAGALEALTIETGFLTLPSLAVIGYFIATGQSHFGTASVGHTFVMLALGPITAVPLLMFGSAAKRVPLSWVGMMQYVAPTLQFIVGVTVMGEHMDGSRWLGFAIIWVTVVLVCTDGIFASKWQRRRWSKPEKA